ncbi:hypothetical protein FEM48_Zijuj02G0043900 [Ziziphus jujuba var. spinosa]|uniref:Uncharacterized protein n=1 Tax=Ziziphus jujuba var. spinosa TaxID=714518 RepID=A0A978VTL6_ZIZJJ|nr:hypothetical protein FEM48_Zijuj02G0043900 [Ziziphus jujuba var. spinosa]
MIKHGWFTRDEVEYQKLLEGDVNTTLKKLWEDYRAAATPSQHNITWLRILTLDIMINNSDMVVLANLEELTVDRSGVMDEIWHAQSPAAYFSKLVFLYLRCSRYKPDVFSMEHIYRLRSSNGQGLSKFKNSKFNKMWKVKELSSILDVFPEFDSSESIRMHALKNLSFLNGHKSIAIHEAKHDRLQGNY